MDSARPSNNPSKLLTLQEAANMLAVSVDVLLSWNEHHILKPTITQTGQIGYTAEQINQFLQIQQSLRAVRLNATQAAMPPRETQESFSRQAEEIHSSSSDSLPGYPETSGGYTKEKANISHSHKAPLLFFSSIATVSAILVIAILTQQGQLNSLFDQYEQSSLNQSKVLGTQTSNLSLTLPAISGIQEQSKTDVALNKNLHNDDSIFAKKTGSDMLADKTNTVISNQKGQVPTSSSSAMMQKAQLAEKTAIPSQTGNDTAPNGTSINATSTYANLATQHTNTQNTTANSSFDKSGNISGKTPQTDVLAMNISGVGITNDTQIANSTTSDARNQLILIILSICGVIVFVMKKPRSVLVETHIERKPILPSEKLLEIDQKMDGTVILYFQGKEYKISKPELHSDSDRFIERLMEVVGPGVKEIEYDNFTDERMRLSTPLSRLVTRLGFVGIKRDLFFPRTSKHNVLFRKYITQDDLHAMHLTVDQITADLTQPI